MSKLIYILLIFLLLNSSTTGQTNHDNTYYTSKSSKMAEHFLKTENPHGISPSKFVGKLTIDSVQANSTINVIDQTDGIISGMDYVNITLVQPLGIYVRNSSNIIIENNRFSNINTGSNNEIIPIFIANSYNVTVRNNEYVNQVTESDLTFISVYNSSSIFIKNNLLENISSKKNIYPFKSISSSVVTITGNEIIHVYAELQLITDISTTSEILIDSNIFDTVGSSLDTILFSYVDTVLLEITSNVIKNVLSNGTITVFQLKRDELSVIKLNLYSSGTVINTSFTSADSSNSLRIDSNRIEINQPSKLFNMMDWFNLSNTYNTTMVDNIAQFDDDLIELVKMGIYTNDARSRYTYNESKPIIPNIEWVLYGLGGNYILTDDYGGEIRGNWTNGGVVIYPIDITHPKNEISLQTVDNNSNIIFAKHEYNLRVITIPPVNEVPDSQEQINLLVYIAFGITVLVFIITFFLYARVQKIMRYEDAKQRVLKKKGSKKKNI